MTTSIDWKLPTLTSAQRAELAGHPGSSIWFTGLSASGKTTVARALDRRLHARGVRSFLLDGDALRTGLTADLGFAPDDRTENLRRYTEVARLFAESGTVALVSAIAPYEAARTAARERIGAHRFALIHVATPIEVCELRDPKGLYQRARAGEIPDFTGVSAPYEEPRNPDLRLVPEDGDAGVMADMVWDLLASRDLLPTR